MTLHFTLRGAAHLGQDEWADVANAVDFILARLPGATVAQICQCIQHGRDCALASEREMMVAEGRSKLN